MSRVHDALARAGVGISDLPQRVAEGQVRRPNPSPHSELTVASFGSASENGDGLPAFERISIQEVDLRSGSRIAFHTDPHGPGADRFRFLRMRLRDLWTVKKLRRVLITSSLPEEGKSTISLNLATALAEHGKRKVLLVEGDLHHSAVARQLGLTSGPGVAECAQDGVDPWTAVRRLEPLGWYLLSAGRSRGNATELIQSDAVANLVHALSPGFDWILIDSPPVLPLTDALSLAKHAQATLLVVRAGRTHSDTIEQAITLLGRENVLGIILNGVSGVDPLYSKYYGHRGAY